jgi:hypothetical protein
MPYLKNKFEAEVGPLADIVTFTTKEYNQLEQDFSTIYEGVQVIYHYRNPGSKFGFLGDDFFRAIPKSCQAVCHRELYGSLELLTGAETQSEPVTMISTFKLQRTAGSR